MTEGILGGKVSVTQIFAKNGILIPVTIIETTPDVVLQVKTNESDGYEAVQIGCQDIHEVSSNRPVKGHAAKAKTSPKHFIRETRDVGFKDYEVGSEIAADSFNGGDVVDITGTIRGHGTQGNIRRWGQSKDPEAHGSRYHRIPGSMGSIINRVPRGKKLPGRMGGRKVAIQNLIIEKIIPEKGVLLVKGDVPGVKNSLIFIKSVARAAKQEGGL